VTQKGTCGKATVEYDDACDWVCTCGRSGFWKRITCHWSVLCSDGKGGFLITEGEGKQVSPPRPPWTVNADATLGRIEKVLAKAFGQPVTVPDDVRDKRIKGTFKGKPEEIAKALGVRLG
jgi:hypothetical protein